MRHHTPIETAARHGGALLAALLLLLPIAASATHTATRTQALCWTDGAPGAVNATNMPTGFTAYWNTASGVTNQNPTDLGFPAVNGSGNRCANVDVPTCQWIYVVVRGTNAIGPGGPSNEIRSSEQSLFCRSGAGPCVPPCPHLMP